MRVPIANIGTPIIIRGGKLIIAPAIIMEIPANTVTPMTILIPRFFIFTISTG
jgi:hypothetical protein